jgi:hypothetical protein
MTSINIRQSYQNIEKRLVNLAKNQQDMLNLVPDLSQ